MMGQAFITRRGGLPLSKGLPEFTYSGECIAAQEGESAENWTIRFLTSGTLVLSRSVKADVFLVGGGGGGWQSTSARAGGGGGGGYTTTGRGVIARREIGRAHV